MNTKNYPLYQQDTVKTLREFTDRLETKYGDQVVFQFRKNKETVSITYRRFVKEVRCLSEWVRKQAGENSHVAILGENSYDWFRNWMGIVYGGNVAVPLDKEMPVGEIKEKISFSDAAFILLSDDYSDYMSEIRSAKTGVVLFSEAERIASGTSAPKPDGPQSAITQNTLATIVFTSGTTGKSKGVMLTHGNYASDVVGCCKQVWFAGNGMLLLPLHHTFGLVASMLVPMFYGRTVYLCRNLRNIAGDLKTAAPQHLLCVPLIVEALYKNIWKSIKEQNKENLVKRMIGFSNLLLRCHIDIRRKLFSSVIKGLGGNLSMVISGGAALNREYTEGLEAFGITLLNGYGITECSPVISVNRNRYNIYGSVGTPLCCNEVRIAEDGEILVRGDNVMKGYYKDQEATQEAMKGGWYHTGDLGQLDKEGVLFITGRKKNLIILNNGENISPEELEERICQEIRYVKEVVVRGSNEIIEAECFLDPAEPQAKMLINDDIRLLNSKLSPSKRIGFVKLRDTEFPKTTTKKIIR